MPLNQAQSAQEKGQNGARAAENGRIKVLAVDNGHFVNEFLEKFLETEGHELLRAIDAKDAVAKTAQFQPDLILLDSAVAAGPVAPLLSQLLLEQSSAAVIVLARQPTIEGAVEAIRLGAIDYVAGPLDAQKLTVAIEAQKAFV